MNAFYSPIGSDGHCFSVAGRGEEARDDLFVFPAQHRTRRIKQAASRFQALPERLKQAELGVVMTVDIARAQQ